jgi:hypothetical protein
LLKEEPYGARRRVCYKEADMEISFFTILTDSSRFEKYDFDKIGCWKWGIVFCFSFKVGFTTVLRSIGIL